VYISQISCSSMWIISILSITFLFHQKVMHDLVTRYITMSQQCAENRTVNEDDINELKQDISALRCELIDILQQSGYSVNACCNAGKEY
jgi:transient receptor potential cation channel subfamily C